MGNAADAGIKYPPCMLKADLGGRGDRTRACRISCCCWRVQSERLALSSTSTVHGVLMVFAQSHVINGPTHCVVPGDCTIITRICHLFASGRRGV